MRTIASEQLICCDIDYTLLMWGSRNKGSRSVRFKDPYEGTIKLVQVHEANLKIVIDRLSRGATILVWSASGHKWATAALAALGVSHRNIIIASKPIAYIDDKPASAWMGEQVFLPVDSTWGQGLKRR